MYRKMLWLQLIALIWLLSVVIAAEMAKGHSDCDRLALSADAKLLSRRRRYLHFPEGSSLQLVYDQIIGIVDYENIHIFGITCALAWQLPHSTIKSSVRPTKPLHNENISVSQTSNASTTSTTSTATATQGNAAKRIDLLHLNTYYNRQNYHEHNGNDLYRSHLTPTTTQTNGIPLNLSGYGTNARMAYGDQSQQEQQQQQQQRRWYDSQRIYPALRMRRHIDTHDRSVNDANIHPDVKNQLHHHRHTRFDLYKSIEKYLDGSGHDGEQCIKRALCETAQLEYFEHHAGNVPDSFAKEILRTVFSLPSAKLHTSHPNKAHKYDLVHNNIETIDCGRQYPKCTSSIWNLAFHL